MDVYGDRMRKREMTLRGVYRCLKMPRAEMNRGRLLVKRRGGGIQVK